MSRIVDPDEWWEPKPDRAAIVREKLASVGISLDDKSVLPGFDPLPLPEPIGPPLPNWWAWRENFVITGEGIVLSLELYQKLGGRLRSTEDQSLEAMQHG